MTKLTHPEIVNILYNAIKAYKDIRPICKNVHVNKNEYMITNGHFLFHVKFNNDQLLGEGSHAIEGKGISAKVIDKTIDSKNAWERLSPMRKSDFDNAGRPFPLNGGYLSKIIDLICKLSKNNIPNIKMGQAKDEKNALLIKASNDDITIESIIMAINE